MHGPSLQAKAIATQHGIPTISPNLHAYMSRALEAHMGDLLRRAYVIARQRSDVGRRMPAMEVGQVVALQACLLLCILA